MAVGFNLNTKSAKLTGGYGETYGLGEKWRLTLTMTMNPWEERLTLATGEDQSQLQIYLNFVHAKVGERGFLDNGDEKRAACIGVLHYFAARERNFVDLPPTLVFENYLTEAQMTEITALARLGRFPSSATVWLENDAGITYGNAPDGSHKIWDNKASPHVPISSIAFELPISEPEEPKALESEPLPGLPKTAVGADLLPEIRSIARMLQWMFALLVALVIFLVALALRR